MGLFELLSFNTHSEILSGGAEITKSGKESHADGQRTNVRQI